MPLRALIVGLTIAICAPGAGFAADAALNDRPMTTTGMQFACPIPPGFEQTNKMEDVPTVLAGKFSDSAPLGKRWNNTDERWAGDPTTGIEFILHRERRWIVGLSTSGIAVTLLVYAFDLNKDGSLSEPTPLNDYTTTCAIAEEPNQKN